MADKITPKDLAAKKDQYVIVDMREPDEIQKEGKMEGAETIPLGRLVREIRHGGGDMANKLKGKKICIYCSVGYRGNIAADELKKEGFEAETIEGGYTAWKEQQQQQQKQ
ncbi:MAG: rhodanese-like domain-containing protein [Thermoproteota archaeon]|nr:rhodanese-like domain-containing protein [Thermoproteota archaeon]